MRALHAEDYRRVIVSIVNIRFVAVSDIVIIALPVIRYFAIQSWAFIYIIRILLISVLFIRFRHFPIVFFGARSRIDVLKIHEEFQYQFYTI